MTTPSFDYLTKSQASTTPVAPQLPAFDYVKPETKPQPQSQGFGDWVSKVAKNWWHMAKLSDEITYAPDDFARDSTPDAMALKNAAQTPSGIPQALHDFAKIIPDMVSSVKDPQVAKQTFMKIATGTGEAGMSILNPFNWPKTAGSLAQGVLSPFVNMTELATGLDLTGNDLRTLTPEDKTERIKNVVAMGALTALSGGTAAALGKLGVAGEIAATTDEAIAAAKAGKAAEAATLAVKAGSMHVGLAERIAKSATAGMVGGASMGAITSAGTGDELSSAAVNGLQFAPLGVAVDLVHGAFTSKKAVDVANIRRVQSIDNKTFPEIVQQAGAIVTSKDVPEAILKGNLPQDDITLENVNAAIKQREAELAATPKDHPEYGGIESTLNVLKLQRDRLTGNVAASATGEPVTPAKLKAALDPTTVADQVLSGKLLPTGGHAVLVQGVDLGRVGQLGTDVPTGYRSVVHVNEDGTGDLLVHNLGEGDHEDFFKKTGFIPGQIVSVDGLATRKVVGGDSKSLVLENSRQGTQTVTETVPPAPVEFNQTHADQSFAKAKTGKPFSTVLVRGSGGTDAKYNDLTAQEPILGPGRYTTPSTKHAQDFGPNITAHKVDLKNPLVIRSDEQWRNLTRGAGWEFPLPVGGDPAVISRDIKFLRKQLEAAGYDGVVVDIPKFESGGRKVVDERTGKTLDRVFGGNQVLEFNPQEPKPSTVSKTIDISRQTVTVPRENVSHLPDVKFGGIVETAATEEMRQAQRAYSEIQKLTKKYPAESTGEDIDRRMARVADKHFSELPTDVQKFMTGKAAHDFETGETHHIGGYSDIGGTGGMNIHGAHIFDLGEAADGLTNADNIPTTIRVSPTSPAIAVNALYDEWRAAANKRPPTQLELIDQQRTLLQSQRSSAPDAATLKSIDNNIARLDAQSKRIQEGLRNDNPIGFDEMPPDDFLDREPTTNLKKSIDDHVDNKGFDNATAAIVKNALYDRLAQEALTKELTPVEQSLVEEAKAELRVPREYDAKKMRQLARSNNYKIQQAGSRILVRTRDNPSKIVFGSDSPREVAEWMAKSGQADGVDLDQSASIPTANASGGIGHPPPNDEHASPEDIPYELYNNTPNKVESGFQSFIRGIDNVPWFTDLRAWANRIDERFGTNFSNDVVDNLNTSRSRRNSALKVWVDRGDKIARLGAKLPLERLETIFTHMETLNPAQVEAEFMGRSMNPEEVALGREVARKKIDTQNVLQYNQELAKLDAQIPIDARNADPKVQAAYADQMNKLQQHFGLDNNHLWAAEQFRNIIKQSRADLSLGAITRLANSIMYDEPTQAEFAAKSKMTPTELKISKMMSDMFMDVGPAIGIPKSKMLGHYISHAQTFYDGDLEKAVRDFPGSTVSRDFYAKLARTGTLSTIDRNPFSVMQRYLKAGFSESSGFNKSVAEANAAWKRDLTKVDPGEQDMVNRTLKWYIQDIQGHPAAFDQLLQGITDGITERLPKIFGVDLAKKMHINIRSLVDGALSTANSALIGMRPAMGGFHIATSHILASVYRGEGYALRAEAMGGYARLHPEMMEEARDAGAIVTISPVTNYSSDEYALAGSKRRVLGRAITKINQIGFRLTLLPDAFESLSAGHYFTTKADAMSALTRYGRGEISWNQVSKELALGKHYQPVITQFERLAKDGKTEDAAKYLGRQVVREIVGDFGNASHPSGWGNVVGRVLGQYGQWPIWYRSTLTRMLSRGTVGERIATVMRLGAYSYAAKRVGDAIGVDLHRLNAFEPLGWMGGPATSTIADISTAIKSSGYMQKQAAGRLQRLLPFKTDEWGNTHIHPTILIPYSYAVDGYVKMLNDMQAGNNMRALFEGSGVRPTSPKR